MTTKVIVLSYLVSAMGQHHPTDATAFTHCEGNYDVDASSVEGIAKDALGIPEVPSVCQVSINYDL
jgi:hypothetical protein